MILFPNEPKKYMKFTLLVLLLFVKNCSGQEAENNINNKNEINNELFIEFAKPIEGFDVKINWTLKDSVSEFYSFIIGPAVFELKRLNDKKKFNINIENFNINDTITGLDIHERFKEKTVPNVLQLEIHPNIYFKDINFDNKKELVIGYTAYDVEINKAYPNHRIFEFVNDELIEIDYFPLQALDWSGEIDYAKQEVITRDYYNCCSYDASYFKYDKNTKEKFIFYKSEMHDVDATNGNEEITVDEKGKKKVTIFKKGK